MAADGVARSGSDLAGRVTSVSDNGPSLVAVAQTATFTNSATYDALNRPVSMVWSPAAAQTAPAAAASVVFTHRYDPTNRRIGQAANDNTWLAYPGPAATTAYTANALNQYTQVGSATPSYDANGNLAFDGTFTYGYDAERRLVSITQGGTPIASYAYDGRGRRKSRTVNGTTTLSVTGAEDQDLLEYDGTTGAVSAVYAYNLGGAIDDVLNRVAPSGARQTLLPDIQGSIIASLDSGGALTKVGYQAFGESTTATAAGAGPRYTGRRLDPETAAAGGAQPSGLYYYRARTYSPTLGRFLQADPAGVTGGVNLYAYVNNDPLNRVDPSGRIALADNLIGAGIGFGVDLVTQLAVNGTYDWRQGAVATAAGFVTSGVSSLIGETALGIGGRAVANAVVGGAVNATQTAALNSIEGTSNSVQSAAVLGATFGYGGSALGDILANRAASALQANAADTALADKLSALNILQSNPALQVPTPGIVAGANALGTAVGNASGFVPNGLIPPDHSQRIRGVPLIGEMTDAKRRSPETADSLSDAGSDACCGSGFSDRVDGSVSIP